MEKKQLDEVNKITDFVIKSIKEHEKKYGEINTQAFKIYLIQAIMATENQLTSALGMLDIIKLKYWDGIKEAGNMKKKMMVLSKLIKAGKVPRPMIEILTDTDLDDVEKNMPPEMRKLMKEILDNAKSVKITKIGDEFES